MGIQVAVVGVLNRLDVVEGFPIRIEHGISGGHHREVGGGRGERVLLGLNADPDREHRSAEARGQVEPDGHVVVHARCRAADGGAQRLLLHHGDRDVAVEQLAAFGLARHADDALLDGAARLGQRGHDRSGAVVPVHDDTGHSGSVVRHRLHRHIDGTDASGRLSVLAGVIAAGDEIELCRVDIVFGLQQHAASSLCDEGVVQLVHVDRGRTVGERLEARRLEGGTNITEGGAVERVNRRFLARGLQRLESQGIDDVAVDRDILALVVEQLDLVPEGLSGHRLDTDVGIERHLCENGCRV